MKTILTPERVVDILIEECYQQYGADRRHILSNWRNREKAIRYRQSIGLILHVHCGYSLNIAGNAIGRNHTTIIHYKGNHAGDYIKDPVYADIYDHLLRHLRSSGLIATSETISTLRLPECLSIIAKQHFGCYTWG